MSDLSTFLIEDPRISKMETSVSMGVKDGPASSIVQKYKPNSNSTASCLFNVNIPSENTLVDPHLMVDATLQFRTTVVLAEGDVISAVPAAFPLNQALQSATLTINNSKVSVQSAEILNVLTKQFHQRYLSKNLQGTPNFVDKYFGKSADAYTARNNAGSYWSNVANAEKDSDTVGRADCDCKITLFRDAAPAVAIDILGKPHTAPNGGTGDHTIHFVFKVREPIFGLPVSALQENMGGLVGVKQVEFLLQWGEIKNCVNIHISKAANGVVPAFAFNQGLNAGFDGSVETSTLLTESSALVMRYMSLHPSQYAKMKKRNVVPFEEFIAYSVAEDRNQQAMNITSNVISLRQVPDKIYICIRPQARDQKAIYSNNLTFPINTLNITFNNVSGLLTDHSLEDLYLMSRRNGSEQTWNEFRGLVKDETGEKLSLGSVVVIDPTRDLGLSDFLSAGSLGQYSFQATATSVGHSDALLPHTPATPANANTSITKVELTVIASYSGVMIIENGSSQSMTGLLTKQSVLEAKSKGSSNIDYEDVERVSGGSIMKQGKSAVKKYLSKELHKGARALDGRVDGAVDRVSSMGKNFAHNKLSQFT